MGRSVREYVAKLPGRSVEETAAELYMLSVMPHIPSVDSFRDYMVVYDAFEEFRPQALKANQD